MAGHSVLEAALPLLRSPRLASLHSVLAGADPPRLLVRTGPRGEDQEAFSLPQLRASIPGPQVARRPALPTSPGRGAALPGAGHAGQCSAARAGRRNRCCRALLSQQRPSLPWPPAGLLIPGPLVLRGPCQSHCDGKNRVNLSPVEFFLPKIQSSTQLLAIISRHISVPET
jgi:hypothetical protein